MQEAVNRNVPLTAEERRLMLALLDGFQPHEVITTAFHFLDLHMPRKLLVPALLWLQKNNLRGKQLADFIAFECGMRFLDFQKRITVALYKDPELRLQAGRNFVL